MRPDRVELILPNDDRLAAVARVVVGWLAARRGTSYESLDDLQLAVESVLDGWRDPAARTTTVEIDVREGELAVAIGPVGPVARGPGSGTKGAGVAEVLAIVVDDHRLVERGGERWLLLEKRMAGAP